MTRSAARTDAPFGHLLAQRRLLVCAVAGALVGFVWPGVETQLARALLGWNVLIWLYLACWP